MDYLLISSVYLLLETYFLISLRVLGFFLAVPIFGGTSTPHMTKVAIAMATGFILMTSQNIAPYMPHSATMTAFFAAGIKEMAVGIVLGFSVYFLIAMFYFIGQMVDYQIGFSMVSVMDPLNQIQIPISGNFFYLTVSCLLLITGAHYNFFRALFYSYQVLPIGSAILSSEHLMRTGSNLFASFLSFGFKTALPIIGSMLVLEVALGILNKATPQMHIFSIGMQLKVIFGLSLVLIVFPMFSNIAEAVFLEINRTLYFMIRGMMPQ